MDAVDDPVPAMVNAFLLLSFQLEQHSIKIINHTLGFKIQHTDF